MHRRALLDKLTGYVPFDDREREAYERLVAFVRNHPDCFERSLSVGHITGAGWLLNGAGDRVLLTHHKKLDKWLQLGGHADGDPDVLRVALREAREESGIEEIEPISTEIFDVDVHPIPAHNGVAAHFHYDVRFLLRTTGDERFAVSDESHELAWVSPEELRDLTREESLARMQRKWIDRIDLPVRA
jgi:8-oxo-dGTP pyrophosphatase MutT (NUDIX family)